MTTRDESGDAGPASDADDAAALLFAAAAVRQAEADALFREYGDALDALREAQALAEKAADAPVTVATLLAAGGVEQLGEVAMRGDWTILVAPDVVDGEDALRLIRSALYAPADVLLDLRGTSLLTSNGARALHDIHRHAQSTRHLAAVLGPVEIVRRVLEITGLDQGMSILPDVLEEDPAANPRALEEPPPGGR